MNIDPVAGGVLAAMTSVLVLSAGTAHAGLPDNGSRSGRPATMSVSDPRPEPPVLDQGQLSRLRALAICAPKYFTALPVLAAPGGMTLFANEVGVACAPVAYGIAQDLYTLHRCSERYGFEVCTGQREYSGKSTPTRTNGRWTG